MNSVTHDQKGTGLLGKFANSLRSFGFIGGGNTGVQERANDPAEKILRLQAGVGATVTSPYMSDATSLQIATFFACVRKLSQGIASLPLEVYKTTEVSGKPNTAVDYKHPAYWLVHENPNTRDTAVEMFEYALANAFIRGIGHILIKRNPFNNDPIELWPLSGKNVEEISMDEGMGRAYKVKGVGMVPQDDMIVLRNFISTNPVREFNRVTGLAFTADEYAARYFSSSGSIAGVIESPNELSQKAKENVREGWNGGAESGHKVRLLEYGLKFTKLTSNPDESQLVEARTFNGEEICRIFDVHPSMVGYKSDSKYNSVEAQNVAFLQHTLMPHIKRFEQQLNKRLLRSNEVSTHAFKWNVKGLLRGDIKTQGEYYDKLIAKGVLSINEVRSLENMNPVEGGDARLVQVNQIPLEHMDEYGKKISAEGTVNTNAQ